ncbi:peptidase M48 [Eikenella longinqua]|uniref:Peptidase M48 n=2 Tax=Eikenella longinqua TaxID=1795827 RepID=A0A1A9RYF4_9NEIS|nr:peptidase M48 [Eikenella longinqua]
MRFFRRQQQARRRSTRLVALYALALAGTVVLTAAVLGSLPLIFGFGSPRHSLWWYYLPPAILVCLLTIGLSLHRLRELRLGGEAVAKRLGGEQLQLQEASFAERRLLNVVAETALAAGLPTPPVYLLRRDGSINAFAAGLSRRRAVIGVTQGAVHRLKRDELQAVIAHEFSHILHGDMRLNLRLSAWLHGLQGIASSGRYFLEGRDDEHYLEYRRNKNVDNHPFDNGIEIIMQTLPLQVFGILMIALGSIGSLFAGWLQAAVCRQREFLADASAVQFTRQTAPLIEALRKIARSGSCRLRSAQGPEYAHMMFGRITSGSLAATHPPIIERIRRLDPAAARRLAPELKGANGPVYFAEGHFRFAPAAEADPVADQSEALYRHRQATMQARIRRYRPTTPHLPLHADWQAAALDGEYASAALLCLFQIHRLPESAAFNAVQTQRNGFLRSTTQPSHTVALTPFVGQQLARLWQHPLLPSTELLEHLLPAFVMQEDSAQQAVLDQIRCHFRQQSASREQTQLWLLLKAYLAPTPQPGHLAQHPAAQALLRAAELPPKQLQTAVKGALLLTDPAKTALLRPLSATLAVSQPLLWRYLCVRLDVGAWHFGAADRRG